MINMERNELNKKIEKVLPPMRRFNGDKRKKKKTNVDKIFLGEFGNIKKYIKIRINNKI